jgi:hypothetical protein
MGKPHWGRQVWKLKKIFESAVSTLCAAEEERGKDNGW